MPDSHSKAFARRLREAVEERRDFDPESVAELVRDDANAARLWERYALVESALDAARVAEAEPDSAIDLADRVFAALGTRTESVAATVRPAVRAVSTTRTGHRGAGVATLLAFSTLAALLVLGMLWRPSSSTELADDVPVESVPVADVEAEEPVLEELVADTRSAYASLTASTRATVDDLAFLVRPTFGIPGVSSPSPMEDGQSDWLDDVGRQLDPLRHDLGDSLDFLLELAPPLDSATS